MEKLHCFAVTLPGLENIAARELESLSVDEISAEEGGVSFQSTMDGVMRVNLRMRVATRILIRLAEFRAHSFPELFNKAARIHWERYIGPATALEMHASSHGSKLLHTGRVEKAVSDAIAQRCAGTAEGGPIGQAQRILVRMDDDICTISIDSSGERLDRRGYRMHSGRAPLRETIAAAMLQWMNWQHDESLVLPMCGSGTFAIEAAWSALHRAAGLDHEFPFRQWPSFKKKRWQRIYAKAEAMRRDVALNICASDLDPEIIHQAERNAEAAGVAGQIRFSVEDFTKTAAPEGAPGVLLCNPPYGDRIKGDVRGLYRQLGEMLRERFGGWRIAVIVPDQGCENALAMPVRDRLKIKHGGKWVYILRL
ncbi:putative N6-adenine-specific DNA methylase [Mariprofundus ferrinatatus]|uniref:Putative N6-adenine-specific DNA methylase n=1 Tax=Mariprofundus ferrinatatus TaxID=1921087 RepID=A0A2K8L451_9PROT|nr:class I SAM-dependent RNA methyltransferase [Mariprofundus ferrinatatus]ATX82108.1 putative N6-adenine-specific DNA methylase [Mariprofundus ferrinatatus]